MRGKWPSWHRKEVRNFPAYKLQYHPQFCSPGSECIEPCRAFAVPGRRKSCRCTTWTNPFGDLRCVHGLHSTTPNLAARGRWTRVPDGAVATGIDDPNPWAPDATWYC